MKIVVIAAVAGLSLAIVAVTSAQGCCGEKPIQGGCPMGGHAALGDAATHSGHAGRAEESTSSASTTASKNRLEKSAQAVFDPYLKVQSALATDSFPGAHDSARQLLQALQGDSKQIFTPDVATQAQALAQAKDLAQARAAFKPLSESLIKYLNDHNVAPGVLRRAYCPMAKARWLQTGTAIANPYFGKSMPDCGEFQN